MGLPLREGPQEKEKVPVEKAKASGKSQVLLYGFPNMKISRGKAEGEKD